jgi:hypothetical protein
MRIATPIALAISLLVTSLAGAGGSSPTSRFLPYSEAAALAYNLTIPLVTFVGTPARQVPGAVCATRPSLEGATGPCIVVARRTVPASDWLEWSATLPVTATDAEIRATWVGADTLSRLNARRARHGLYALEFDAGLTAAAASAAHWRAARLCDGHCPDDFAHVPAGTSAACAGCAAWEPWVVDQLGWGSCNTETATHRYAGAAMAVGSDGRWYMHTFYR